MNKMDILLSAFQIPGWVKEMKPTMMTLKSGLRYQRVNLETGFVCGCPASSSDPASLVDFASSSDTLVSDILPSMIGQWSQELGGYRIREASLCPETQVLITSLTRLSIATSLHE